MKAIYLDAYQIHSNTDVGNLMRAVSPKIEGLEIPEMRLPSFHRPNVDGAIIPNQLYGGRLVSFNGKVWGVSLANYRQQRRDMANAMAVLRGTDGSLMSRLLKFTTMDDLNLQINGYVKSFDFPDEFLGHGNYSASFYAEDPFIYSQDLQNSNVFIYSGGGMPIPMPIPMSMAAGASAETTVSNLGNAEAYPILSFFGVMNDATLTNMTTGKALSLDYDLDNASKSIVVDTRRRTATYYSAPGANGVNVRQNISGDFLSIIAGTNYLKLTATSGTTGYVNISFRHTYSGI